MPRTGRRRKLARRSLSWIDGGVLTASLRAKRSNPYHHAKKEWIASSQGLLAMTARRVASLRFRVVVSAPTQKTHPCPYVVASSASLRATAARRWQSLRPCPTARRRSAAAAPPQTRDGGRQRREPGRRSPAA